MGRRRHCEGRRRTWPGRSRHHSPPSRGSPAPSQNGRCHEDLYVVSCAMRFAIALFLIAVTADARVRAVRKPVIEPIVQFRGDTGRTGVVPGTGPRTFTRVAWQTSIGEASFTAPVYANGRVYVSNGSGRIVALDAANGTDVLDVRASSAHSHPRHGRERRGVCLRRKQAHVCAEPRERHHPLVLSRRRLERPRAARSEWRNVPRHGGRQRVRARPRNARTALALQHERAGALDARAR